MATPAPLSAPATPPKLKFTAALSLSTKSLARPPIWSRRFGLTEFTQETIQRRHHDDQSSTS